MPREFERLAVDNVHICRRHGEDDAVWLGDVFSDEVSGLLFDVGGLVANRDLDVVSRTIQFKLFGRRALVKPGKSTNVRDKT